MNSNVLTKYAEFVEKKQRNNEQVLAPVITISRECGCSAKRIATKLSKILTGYSYHSETKTDIEWNWVSKEIIEEASKELEVAPQQIRNVFMSEKKLTVSEVASAFSTERIYDSDDQLVIDTVGKVIRNFAEAGNYIIVGRGAEIFAHTISDRLSIRLQAPLDWRINRIMQISNMSYSDARDYVLEIDRQRELFVEHVAGRKLENTDFDVVFNYSTMLDDHIVDAIVNILRSRRII